MRKRKNLEFRLQHDNLDITPIGVIQIVGSLRGEGEGVILVQRGRGVTPKRTMMNEGMGEGGTKLVNLMALLGRSLALTPGHLLGKLESWSYSGHPITIARI